jgi:transcriptional regulator with XRE-family HTH domain
MAKLYTRPILKSWREEKGYTQQEMVGLLSIELDRDISMSTYQKWEQGTLNLTPDNALELSRFTRIDLQDLVERK